MTVQMRIDWFAIAAIGALVIAELTILSIGQYWWNIAAVIAAFIGPIAGVAIANRFSNRVSLRSEASSIYRSLNTHMYDLQSHLLEQRNQRSEGEGIQERLLEAVRDNDDTLYSHLLNERTEFFTRSRTVRDAVRELFGQIDSDYFTIELLFLVDATRTRIALLQAVRESIIGLYNTSANLDQCETWEAARDELNAAMQDVRLQLRLLYSNAMGGAVDLD